MSEEKGKPKKRKDKLLEELDFDLGDSNQNSSDNSSSPFDELDELDDLLGKPAPKENQPAAKEEKNNNTAADLPDSSVTGVPGRLSQEDIERILKESPDQLIGYEPPAVETGGEDSGESPAADNEKAGPKISKLELEELEAGPPSKSGGGQISPEELQRLIDEAQADKLSPDDTPSQAGSSDFGISPEELQALMDGADEEIVEYGATAAPSRHNGSQMSPEELQRLIDEAQGSMIEESLAEQDTSSSSEISADELQALLDAAAQEPAADEQALSENIEMSPDELQALLDQAQSTAAAEAEPPSTEISADELQALMDAAADEPQGPSAEDDAATGISNGELQALMDEAGEEIFDDTPPELPPAAPETPASADAMEQEPFDEMLNAWKAEESPAGEEIIAEVSTEAQTVVEEEPAAIPEDEGEPALPQATEELEQAEDTETGEEAQVEGEPGELAEEIPVIEEQIDETAEAEGEAEEEAEGEGQETAEEGKAAAPSDGTYDVDIDALLDGAEAKAAADEAAEARAAEEEQPVAQVAEAKPAQLDDRTMWIVAAIAAAIILCACAGSVALIFIYQEDLGIRISLAPLLPVVQHIMTALI